MAFNYDQVAAVDAYWRAANYLGAAMIHLNGGFLSPTLSDVKKRILGHWGSSPGQAFIWAHLNRLIIHTATDDRFLFLSGPGHGAPGMIGPVWLDDGYRASDKPFSRDLAGANELCRQFSAPGGIGSHCTPETPGSIHEGGELGYSLSHAAGAVLDAPETIAVAVVGDGEAETGPIATAWNISRFLRPKLDGHVLPIVHLNGYKIANPSILARMPRQEQEQLFRGYGWAPLFVDYDGDTQRTHRSMALALEVAYAAIRRRQVGEDLKPPMIVLSTPKGWTGPERVDNKLVEGYWRSHQVPLPRANDDWQQFAQLRYWLESYRPAELFNPDGTPTTLVLDNVPAYARSIVDTAGVEYDRPGIWISDDDIFDLEVPVDEKASNTYPLGKLLAKLYERFPNRFRLFGPDETASNRLQAVYEVSKKVGKPLPVDVNGTEIAEDGRVIEMLSEHTLVGMMEGYLMMGGAGFFHTYEAFGHIISSMCIQHGKWLAATRDHAPWRAPINSWNCLLSSTVWRQDHNGGTHQQPGFIDIATQMDPEFVRVYLPADANSLLAVAQKALPEQNAINLIVADKQNHQQFFTMDQAIDLVERGAGVVPGYDCLVPDVILACSGDVVTQEVVAAADCLIAAGQKVQVVNVVNLFYLRDASKEDFEKLFPPCTPVVFNFHGYTSLVKSLLFDRGAAVVGEWTIHGFCDKGSINTPLELCIINGVDRYTVALAAMQRSAAPFDAKLAVSLTLEQEKALDHAYSEGVDA